MFSVDDNILFFRTEISKASNPRNLSLLLSSTQCFFPSLSIGAATLYRSAVLFVVQNTYCLYGKEFLNSCRLQVHLQTTIIPNLWD